MRLVINIFPISEKNYVEGPKSIIIFSIFSLAVIAVYLRLQTLINLTVQQKIPLCIYDKPPRNLMCLTVPRGTLCLTLRYL